MRSSSSRFMFWLSRLESAQACSSALQAFNLLKSEWANAYAVLGSSDGLPHAFSKRKFCSEYGWVGIGTRVAYLDYVDECRIRIYLHQDGGIVVQSFDGNQSKILLMKDGAAAFTLKNNKAPKKERQAIHELHSVQDTSINARSWRNLVSLFNGHKEQVLARSHFRGN